MIPAPPPAITSADIDIAARTIAGHAIRTPLVACPAIDAATGARVLLKLEILQRTGSFKFRGAYNCIAGIPSALRAKGVVAFSSGNHAQGVAAAAAIFGIPATIVMPADAPLAKRQRTAELGGRVVLYDRDREDRDAIARAIAAESGATVVPPYDDLFVMAGQGTVGLEIAEDCATLGVSPDIVIAPASGGGLVAGIATALAPRFSAAKVYCAEPAGFDDHARSLRAGQRVAHGNTGRTICDALMAAIPGEITFATNGHALAGSVVADDAQVGRAVAMLFREAKLVVEPGGAVGLAALLAGALDVRGKTVVLVLSGGNVDAELFAKLIA